MTDLELFAALRDRLAGTSIKELPDLLGLLEAERMRAQSRLLRGQNGGAEQAPEPRAETPAADHLLTVSEASARLGMRPQWIYRNQARLPFLHRVGAGSLRCSERGIARYLESRRRELR